MKNILKKSYTKHTYGFREELFQLVKDYELDYPKMSQLDRYQKGYEKLITKYNEL